MDVREDMYNQILMLFMKKMNFEDAKMELRLILDQFEIQARSTQIALLKEDRNEFLMQKFIIAKAVKGCTERTVKYYRTTLRSILEKIGKTVDDITADDIRLYVATRIRVDHVSKVTADNELRVLRTFFSYLQVEEIINKNPITRVDRIKVSRQKKDALTDLEVEKLRYAIANEKDRAAFEIMLSTGCRVSELINIKLDEIKDDQVLVHGKGEKDRTVYLNAKALMAISQYVSLRSDQNPYLFPKGKTASEQGKRLGKNQGDWWKFPENIEQDGHMDKGTVEQTMRRIAKRAGVEKANPHKIRRTCATTALKRGMPLLLVSKMLGHEQLETTKIYLDITQDDLEMAHKKYVV